VTLVLNTRPTDQSAELSSLLRAAGFDVVEIPAIEIEPVTFTLSANAYDWLVLQSQNAARALPTLPRGRIVCGLATARALAVEPAVALERFSATAALDALRPRVRQGERVLVPRAAEGRDELVDGLRALGVDVEAPICYRTVGRPHAFADAPAVDVVTLCSPSAVRAVVDGIGRSGLLAARVVCLGETTANAAAEAGLRVDAVARRTSMPSLVAAVRSVAGVPV
jgi:uroporphyrinogen-III synthase